MEKNTLQRLRAEERRLRQQVIIDSARRMFGQENYQRVSMADIAKDAGIAKSSIYTYFKSQEELFARVVYLDGEMLISDLSRRIKGQGKAGLKIVISQFLDYYIQHKAQWRMITHLALNGSKEKAAIKDLNQSGVQLLDLFESIFTEMGCTMKTRYKAHALLSCLSGILISFRNIPGRSEAHRIAHMHLMGGILEDMILALIEKED